MILVVALNVIAAVAVIGGLSLAMWALYRGLGNQRTGTAAPGTPQQRTVPSAPARHVAGSASRHAAWSAR